MFKVVLICIYMHHWSIFVNGKINDNSAAREPLRAVVVHLNIQIYFVNGWVYCRFFCFPPIVYARHGREPFGPELKAEGLMGCPARLGQEVPCV
jgi:hypothetical protein